MTNHVVLFEPEIYANSGNIARTCAATNSVLHFIEPIGFDLNDSRFKRAAVNYFKNVEYKIHQSLPDFLETTNSDDQLLLVTKFAKQTYDKVEYTNSNIDYYFIFGKESTGLPEVFLQDNQDKTIRIPQDDQKVNSLNVSNAVAIILYEAQRQQNFNQLDVNFDYQNGKLK